MATHARSLLEELGEHNRVVVLFVAGGVQQRQTPASCRLPSVRTASAWAFS
jgi:hypothetical protein